MKMLYEQGGTLCSGCKNSSEVNESTMTATDGCLAALLSAALPLVLGASAVESAEHPEGCADPCPGIASASSSKALKAIHSRQ
jgi:hypothetical protein